VDPSPIGALQQFIGTINIDVIDPDALLDARRFLLDAIACAFVGHTSPETPVVDGAIRQSMGGGTATVIGGTEASPAAAAAINGYLITARSLCDMHRPTLSHITPVVIPAALAAAERIGANGSTFLAGVVAGMETTVRLGYALNYEEFRRRGWHTPGVAGPFGSAAAAARIGALENEQIASALGIAGSHAGGTFASFGTPTIKFHQARAAMAGLISADLAAHGFKGNPEILTAKDGGILNTFTDGGDPTAITEALGEIWRLREISTRLWPTAAALQSVVTAVLELRGSVSPRQVASIEIALPQASYDMNAHMTWEDTFHATLSARWVAAVTLVDGQCWLDQFKKNRLNDDHVAALAVDRVSVVLDRSLPEGGCEVTFRMKDGRTITDLRRLPRGHPEDPTTAKETREKFHRSVAGSMDGDRADLIIDLIDTVEQIPDMRELTALLAFRDSRDTTLV